MRSFDVMVVILCHKHEGNSTVFILSTKLNFIKFQRKPLKHAPRNTCVANQVHKSCYRRSSVMAAVAMTLNMTTTVLATTMHRGRGTSINTDYFNINIKTKSVPNNHVRGIDRFSHYQLICWLRNSHHIRYINVCELSSAKIHVLGGHLHKSPSVLEEIHQLLGCWINSSTHCQHSMRGKRVQLQLFFFHCRHEKRRF